MEELHKKVFEQISKMRKDARARYDQRNKAKSANFSLGDYVLVAKIQKVFRDKLSLNWNGPYRIIEVISNHLFRVESLLDTKDTKVVHSQRLKFYHDESLRLTEHILRYAKQDKQTYDIDRLLDLKSNGSSYDVYVKWQGFDEQESTWEPIEVLYEDVPLMLYDFLKTKDEGLEIWKSISSSQ
jgi:hypothetical protein